MKQYFVCFVPSEVPEWDLMRFLIATERRVVEYRPFDKGREIKIHAGSDAAWEIFAEKAKEMNFFVGTAGDFGKVEAPLIAILDETISQIVAFVESKDLDAAQITEMIGAEEKNKKRTTLLKYLRGKLETL